MNASTMAVFVTLAVAALLGALQAFSGNVQTATMWAGRAIVPADFGPTPSNGVQDAITPPWQTKLQFVWQIGLVVVLVVGTLQLWYFGVAALIVAGCTSVATRLELPREAAYYLHLIESSLAGRMANYSRDGDYMRTEVARGLLQRVSVLLDETNRSNRALPSFREARSTPFGQLDADVPHPASASKWRPPETFLDDGVPERLRTSAETALVELRDLGATDEEIREILSVPEGATPLGLMEGMRTSNHEWNKNLSAEDRREWIDWFIESARHAGSAPRQGP